MIKNQLEQLRLPLIQKGLICYPEDSYKGKGIGTKLFEKAVEWSKERNCVQMKIETQNINSKACEFYKKQGSILGKIDEYAYYGDCDGEVQLIWYKNL
jgi:ribosomal protein S18 acetylase RimI-like enzyme